MSSPGKFQPFPQPNPTPRELYAAIALHALLANPDTINETAASVARRARMCADALVGEMTGTASGDTRRD